MHRGKVFSVFSVTATFGMDIISSKSVLLSVVGSEKFGLFLLAIIPLTNVSFTFSTLRFVSYSTTPVTLQPLSVFVDGGTLISQLPYSIKVVSCLQLRFVFLGLDSSPIKGASSTLVSLSQTNPP